MKNKGICPKCGGDDIRIVEGFYGRYGEGNSFSLGLMGLHSFKKDTYICCDCGFTEEWLAEEDLETVLGSKKAKKRPKEE